MSNPNKRRFLRATATALSGAVLAMVCAVAPASAAPGDSPLVDASQRGSITVHKFEKPADATGLAANGTALTQAQTSGLRALDGVTFSVQQVSGINVGTNAGWEASNALSNAFDAANAVTSIAAKGHSLGTAVTAVTGAGGTAGVASFPDLGLGLYLVTETVVPAGVTPSAPFLVSVPLTDPDNKDNWLYNVHVYPKNATSTATKTVADAPSVKLGDTATFTITGGIPNVGATDGVDGYKVVDELDAKLEYVSTTVSLVGGGTLNAADYTVTQLGNTITVLFTADGLAKLTANQSSKVQVVITAKVQEIGEIANVAKVYPNKHSIESNTSPIETPEVLTKWGEITLEKANKADNTPVAGAVFSVFASEADAKAGTNPINFGTETAPVTTFTTPASGELTISGLRYSDWANGKSLQPGDTEYRNYYLVEVQAPAGFELLAAPVAFTVTAASTAVGVDFTVYNVPSNGGFELPLTGGTGTVLLYAGGILLVLGATLLLIRSRRTQN